MRISCSDSSMCADTSATRSWLTRDSRRTRRPISRIGTSVAGTPSTISAASLALVANSSTSAPAIISALRRSIEKPKPITCRSCSLSLVRREAISPVRAESKNAGDSVRTCANTRLAQVGDHALADAHHEVEARPGRARQHDGDRHHGGERGIEQARVAAAEPGVHHVAQSLPQHEHAAGRDDQREQARRRCAQRYGTRKRPRRSRWASSPLGGETKPGDCGTPLSYQ